VNEAVSRAVGTTVTGRDWVAQVVTQYQHGRPLALLFDYDGTLTPIVGHPSLALLPEETGRLLADLAAADNVTLGVVSGRALAHLRDLVRLPGVRYAGSGGMHLDLDGLRVCDPAADEFDRIVDAITEAISEPVRWFPGAWVEWKPGCVAVHYRALTPLKAACLREVVRDTLVFLAEAAPPLRVRDSSQSLQIALASSWTKGDAAGRILRDLDPTAVPVYAGDGETDLEAVARVNAAGGLTIGVGPEPPAGVHARVPDPAALAADLARLRDGLLRADTPDRPDRPGEHSVTAIRDAVPRGSDERV
jgi:trehalose-phosphatase